MSVKRFCVSLWILVITATQFGRGSSLKSCQEMCCSTPTNQTAFGLNLEKGINFTANCQDCLRNQSLGLNLTQEQLCVKQQVNKTNVKKETHKSVCQEMFDNASNDFVGLVTGVKVHFQREDGFWYINVTWNALNDPKISKNWSHYAIQWMSSLEDEGGCALVPKNRTFFIINETENGWRYPKPIHLNVSTYPLKKNTGYRYEIQSRPLPDMPKIPTTVPSSKVSPQIIAAIIGGSCAGIILITIVILAWRMRKPDTWIADYINRILSPKQNQGDFDYDASILYSSLDEKWVTEQLIPLLESENDFKCFIHFRDYEAGKVIHENMADSVYSCRKNLAVVSKNFLKSQYCKTEMHMALERVNRCGDCSLIVINLDGVPIDQLPRGLRIRTFVNLTSSQEQKTWRNRLVKQISVEENKQRSKTKGDTLQGSTESCQVTGHINDIHSSSTESV